MIWHAKIAVVVAIIIIFRPNSTCGLLSEVFLIFQLCNPRAETESNGNHFRSPLRFRVENGEIDKVDTEQVQKHAIEINYCNKCSAANVF